MAVSTSPAALADDPQTKRPSDTTAGPKIQPTPVGPSPVAPSASVGKPKPKPVRKTGVRGPGLQAKIILLMVVSLILLALISSFATSTALQTRMVADTEAKAEAIARGLATSGSDERALAGLIDRLAEIEDVVYLVVYDRFGRLVASSYEGALPSQLATAPESTGTASRMIRLQPGGAGARPAGTQVTALDLVRPLDGGGTVRVGMDFDSVLTEVRRININLLVIQGLVALIAVFFTLLFSARLVRPIRTLVQLAEAVGRGDLSRTVRVKSSDEVGLLSRTFNDTIRRLRGLVVTEGERDEERARREALQSNIRRFLGVSRQVSQGDLRLRGEVTDDVLGSVVDSINLMIEEIGGTLVDVRESAETSAGSARLTREAAQTGRQAVGESLESMQQIRSEVQGISRRIKSLGERSLEISEIVDTITGISSQTNLLAINAAIEASGAGEQGARFAVVADEVRKLAEESSTSSKRIAGLIKAVQSEVFDAVGAMDKGTVEVETGYRLAQQAGERLEEIARISDLSAEVASQLTERLSRFQLPEAP